MSGDLGVIDFAFVAGLVTIGIVILAATKPRPARPDCPPVSPRAMRRLLARLDTEHQRDPGRQS